MSASGLKFLVDVGVGRKVEECLVSHGYDTKLVRDIDPRLEDGEIIRIAVSEDRIIITSDNYYDG